MSMATNGKSNRHKSRPNSPADIQHASIIDSDLGTPSEDDSPETREYPTEDAQSVIGVSIGRAQSRLMSPRTPAAEKAAAIEDLDGDGYFASFEPPGAEKDSHASRDGVTSTSKVPVDTPTASTGRAEFPTPPAKKTTPDSPLARFPSPWRAGPRESQRTDEVKTSLRDSLSKHKRGASMEGSRKLLGFNLPSLPFSLLGKWSSSGPIERDGSQKIGNTDLSSRGSSTLVSDSSTQFDSLWNLAGSSGSSTLYNPRETTVQNRSSYDAGTQRTTSIPSSSSNLVQDPLKSSIGRAQFHPSLQHYQSRQLRRVASDDSLLLHRTLSRTSSLGDDSRFEHVQEQVNNRLKAVKDSFQDANFRLPSLPAIRDRSFVPSRPDILRSKEYPASAKNPSRSHKKSLSHASALAKELVYPSRRSTITQDDPPTATAGTTATNAAAHPYFTKALEDLTGDVVILGGYRGSILRSAEPPHRRLWVPIKVGLNLRKVDLEVGLNPEDEEAMEKTVIPGGMLTHIGPVDISRRLFKRLRASENVQTGKLRVHDYGYDWRLSPHLLSRKFIQYLEKLPCNAPNVPAEQRGATVIAHSLGGLITRHVINQRPNLVAGVVYAGVPHTCVNILGPFRNGDDVLLSSRVLTAQVNFTIRTSFALLPLDGKCFFNKHTKEEYPVDFFNPNDWIKYCFSPCVAQPLPPINVVPSSTIGGIIGSMASVLPNLPIIGRRSSLSKRNTFQATPDTADTEVREATSSTTVAAAKSAEGGATDSGIAPQMGGNSQHNPAEYGRDPNTSVATAVTIPREAAVAYLTRTLAEVKRFKEELAFNHSHGAANRYPPAAVIYGKSTPTVYGAKVASREAIKRTDAYDELAFGSGDGVVLARAAMVPEGYQVVRGGVVSSDRGHVTLLGDLEAVGRCLCAVVAGRRAGVGLGRGDSGGL